MADNTLQEVGRQESAAPEVPQLRVRRKDKASPASDLGQVVNWEVMTILLMQMQEHVEILSRQDGLNQVGKKAVKGLTDCANELLPKLIAEARKQGG